MCVESLPRLVSATVRNYLEGGPDARVAILVFVAVGLSIVALGLLSAINSAWLLVTIPAKLRGRKGRGAGPEAVVRLIGDLKLFEIALGIVGFAICLAMIAFVLLASEGFLSRRGAYGGAGATVVWRAPQP